MVCKSSFTLSLRLSESALRSVTTSILFCLTISFLSIKAAFKSSRSLVKTSRASIAFSLAFLIISSSASALINF